MADLEWHDFYEIGIDFIDAEHKQILEIMRGMQEAVIGCDPDASLSLSNSLIEVSEKHFRREEAFLRKVKYPQLGEHVEYHQLLIKQAERIRDTCQNMDTEHDLQRCFDEMEKYLIDDIMYGDIKFKSYLEFAGYIKSKY